MFPSVFVVVNCRIVFNFVLAWPAIAVKRGGIINLNHGYRQGLAIHDGFASLVCC